MSSIVPRAPIFWAIRSASARAFGSPESTICSAVLKFAAVTTPAALAFATTSAICFSPSPMTDSMEPLRFIPAAAIARPRRYTNCTASSNRSDPASTSAAYSPRLSPAAATGFTAARRVSFRATSRNAMLVTRIAGCEYCVSASFSSGPEKHSATRSKSTWSEARLNRSRARG